MKLNKIKIILSKTSLDIFFANHEPRGIKHIKITVENTLKRVISKLKKL